MKNILLILAILINSESAFSSACLNYNKNCQGISATKMYLGATPVCVMRAKCDIYCGMMMYDRKITKLYCGFRAISGDEYVCMSAEECNEDTSVIKSDRDISRLSYTPKAISGGTGLTIPENGGSR